MGCGPSCLGHATPSPVPLDEDLGHSFCYTHPSLSTPSFKSISGAAVSANSTAPLPAFSRSRHPNFLTSSSFSTAPLDRSTLFLSGPIEPTPRSGPIEPGIPFSGPIVKRMLRRTFSERQRPWVVPLRSLPGGVEWAQGKAGEDRVHVVVSEEESWLFVGIYDGFNGPDAPEYLLENLYQSVFNELRGLFWDDGIMLEEEGKPIPRRRLWELLKESEKDDGVQPVVFSLSKLRNGLGSLRKEVGWNWFPRWRYDSEDKAEVAREAGGRRRKAGAVSDHGLVLRGLSRALETTEVAYLEMTDRAMGSNPELALTGSCVLVVVMRDDDVYVLNVGDCRAIVARSRVREEFDGGMDDGSGEELELPACEEVELKAAQLSTDHSTSIEEEVLRIKEEHPDDDRCIVNKRVKGRLQVTRAFGAGFLKQPKWNNSLLEMFRNEYIGTAPYISCTPSLCHHKLGPNDQFLVLSSDGLYQYLSNEEVVLHVGSFMERFPDGDPAQSLIEELLSRAATKAGMDFDELLDIPQGARRKYHDDVTVVVISLQGRIWNSSGNYL